MVEGKQSQYNFWLDDVQAEKHILARSLALFDNPCLTLAQGRRGYPYRLWLQSGLWQAIHGRVYEFTP